MIICPICGKKLGEYMQKCIYCGADLMYDDEVDNVSKDKIKKAAIIGGAGALAAGAVGTGVYLSKNKKNTNNINDIQVITDKSNNQTTNAELDSTLDNQEINDQNISESDISEISDQNINESDISEISDENTNTFLSNNDKTRTIADIDTKNTTSSLKTSNKNNGTTNNTISSTETIEDKTNSSTEINENINGDDAIEISDTNNKTTTKSNDLSNTSTKEANTNDSIQLNNNVIKIESITLNKKKEVLSVGESITLKVTKTPENATENYYWESSASTVADIDQKGVVRAMSNGKASVGVVTDSNLQASCLIVVKDEEVTSPPPSNPGNNNNNDGDGIWVNTPCIIKAYETAKLLQSFSTNYKNFNYNGKDTNFFDFIQNPCDKDGQSISRTYTKDSSETNDARTFFNGLVGAGGYASVQIDKINQAYKDFNGKSIIEDKEVQMNLGSKDFITSFFAAIYGTSTDPYILDMITTNISNDIENYFETYRTELPLDSYTNSNYGFTDDKGNAISASDLTKQLREWSGGILEQYDYEHSLETIKRVANGEIERNSSIDDLYFVSKGEEFYSKLEEKFKNVIGDRSKWSDDTSEQLKKYYDGLKNDKKVIEEYNDWLEEFDPLGFITCLKLEDNEDIMTASDAYSADGLKGFMFSLMGDAFKSFTPQELELYTYTNKMHSKEMESDLLEQEYYYNLALEDKNKYDEAFEKGASDTASGVRKKPISRWFAEATSESDINFYIDSIINSIDHFNYEGDVNSATAELFEYLELNEKKYIDEKDGKEIDPSVDVRLEEIRENLTKKFGIDQFQLDEYIINYAYYAEESGENTFDYEQYVKQEDEDANINSIVNSFQRIYQDIYSEQSEGTYSYDWNEKVLSDNLYDTLNLGYYRYDGSIYQKYGITDEMLHEMYNDYHDFKDYWESVEEAAKEYYDAEGQKQATAKFNEAGENYYEIYSQNAECEYNALLGMTQAAYLCGNSGSQKVVFADGSSDGLTIADYYYNQLNNNNQSREATVLDRILQYEISSQPDNINLIESIQNKVENDINSLTSYDKYIISILNLQSEINEKNVINESTENNESIEVKFSEETEKFMELYRNYGWTGYNIDDAYIALCKSLLNFSESKNQYNMFLTRNEIDSNVENVSLIKSEIKDDSNFFLIKWFPKLGATAEQRKSIKELNQNIKDQRVILNEEIIMDKNFDILSLSTVKLNDDYDLFSECEIKSIDYEKGEMTLLVPIAGENGIELQEKVISINDNEYLTPELLALYFINNGVHIVNIYDRDEDGNLYISGHEYEIDSLEDCEKFLKNSSLDKDFRKKVEYYIKSFKENIDYLDEAFDYQEYTKLLMYNYNTSNSLYETALLDYYNNTIDKYGNLFKNITAESIDFNNISKYMELMNIDDKNECRKELYEIYNAINFINLKNSEKKYSLFDKNDDKINDFYQYFGNILDTALYISASHEADAMLDGGVISDFATLLWNSLWTNGIRQFGNGFANLFKADGVKNIKDYIGVALQNKTFEQYNTALAKAFNSLYEINCSIGNMLPPIVAGWLLGPLGAEIGVAALGAITSTTLMGLSAAGNSKEDFLKENMDLFFKTNGGESVSWNQMLLMANVYGALSGASEALLERFLGSIPVLGQVVKEKGILGFIRAGWDESKEEMLQEILEPIFKNVTLALGTGDLSYLENGNLLADPEAILKAGIYAFITSAIMSGGKFGSESISYLMYGDYNALSTIISSNIDIPNYLQLLKYHQKGKFDLNGLIESFKRINNNETSIASLREALLASDQFQQIYNQIEENMSGDASGSLIEGLKNFKFFQNLYKKIENSILEESMISIETLASQATVNSLLQSDSLSIDLGIQYAQNYLNNIISRNTVIDLANDIDELISNYSESFSDETITSLTTIKSLLKTNNSITSLYTTLINSDFNINNSEAQTLFDNINSKLKELSIEELKSSINNDLSIANINYSKEITEENQHLVEYLKELLSVLEIDSTIDMYNKVLELNKNNPDFKSYSNTIISYINSLLNSEYNNEIISYIEKLKKNTVIEELFKEYTDAEGNLDYDEFLNNLSREAIISSHIKEVDAFIEDLIKNSEYDSIDDAKSKLLEQTKQKLTEARKVFSETEKEYNSSLIDSTLAQEQKDELNLKYNEAKNLVKKLESQLHQYESSFLSLATVIATLNASQMVKQAKLFKTFRELISNSEITEIETTETETTETETTETSEKEKKGIIERLKRRDPNDLTRKTPKDIAKVLLTSPETMQEQLLNMDEGTRKQVIKELSNKLDSSLSNITDENLRNQLLDSAMRYHKETFEYLSDEQLNILFSEDNIEKNAKYIQYLTNNQIATIIKELSNEKIIRLAINNFSPNLFFEISEELRKEVLNNIELTYEQINSIINYSIQNGQLIFDTTIFTKLLSETDIVKLIKSIGKNKIPYLYNMAVKSNDIKIINYINRNYDNNLGLLLNRADGSLISIIGKGKVLVGTNTLYAFEINNNIIYTNIDLIEQYSTSNDTIRKQIVDEILTNTNLNTSMENNGYIGNIDIDPNTDIVTLGIRDNTIITGLNSLRMQFENLLNSKNNSAEKIKFNHSDNVNDVEGGKLIERTSTGYQLSDSRLTSYYTDIINFISNKYGLPRENINYIISEMLDNNVDMGSYSDLANSIFYSFLDKENLFKEIFGFDMYSFVDGEFVLNKTLLVTDIYIYANSGNGNNSIFNVSPDGTYSINTIKTIFGTRLAGINEQVSMIYKTRNGFKYSKNAIRYLESYGLDVVVENIKYNRNNPTEFASKILLGLAKGEVINICDIIGSTRMLGDLKLQCEDGKILSISKWYNSSSTTLSVVGLNENGVDVIFNGKKYTILYSNINMNPNNTIGIKFYRNNSELIEIDDSVILANEINKKLLLNISENIVTFDELYKSLSNEQFENLINYVIENNYISKLMSKTDSVILQYEILKLTLKNGSIDGIKSAINGIDFTDTNVREFFNSKLSSFEIHISEYKTVNEISSKIIELSDKILSLTSADIRLTDIDVTQIDNIINGLSDIELNNFIKDYLNDDNIASVISNINDISNIIKVLDYCKSVLIPDVINNINFNKFDSNDIANFLNLKQSDLIKYSTKEQLLSVGNNLDINEFEKFIINISDKNVLTYIINNLDANSLKDLLIRSNSNLKKLLLENMTETNILNNLENIDLCDYSNVTIITSNVNSDLLIETMYNKNLFVEIKNFLNKLNMNNELENFISNLSSNNYQILITNTKDTLLDDVSKIIYQEVLNMNSRKFHDFFSQLDLASNVDNAKKIIYFTTMFENEKMFDEAFKIMMQNKYNNNFQLSNLDIDTYIDFFGYESYVLSYSISDYRDLYAKAIQLSRIYNAIKLLPNNNAIYNHDTLCQKISSNILNSILYKLNTMEHGYEIKLSSGSSIKLSNIDVNIYSMAGEQAKLLVFYNQILTKVFASINPSIVSYLSNITIHDTINFSDSYWAINYNKDAFNTFYSAATGGNGRINFYAPFINDVVNEYLKNGLTSQLEKNIILTVYHELGHNIDNYFKFKDMSEWDNAVKSDNRYISSYAKTNYTEDVAESFAHYMIDRKNFKKVCPNRFEILDNYYSQIISRGNSLININSSSSPISSTIQSTQSIRDVKYIDENISSQEFYNQAMSTIDEIINKYNDASIEERIEILERLSNNCIDALNILKNRYHTDSSDNLLTKFLEGINNTIDINNIDSSNLTADNLAKLIDLVSKTYISINETDVLKNEYLKILFELGKQKNSVLKSQCRVTNVINFDENGNVLRTTIRNDESLASKINMIFSQILSSKFKINKDIVIYDFQDGLNAFYQLNNEIVNQFKNNEFENDIYEIYIEDMLVDNNIERNIVYNMANLLDSFSIISESTEWKKISNSKSFVDSVYEFVFNNEQFVKENPLIAEYLLNNDYVLSSSNLSSIINTIYNNSNNFELINDLFFSLNSITDKVNVLSSLANHRYVLKNLISQMSNEELFEIIDTTLEISNSNGKNLLLISMISSNTDFSIIESYLSSRLNSDISAFDLNQLLYVVNSKKRIGINYEVNSELKSQITNIINNYNASDLNVIKNFKSNVIDFEILDVNSLVNKMLEAQNVQYSSDDFGSLISDINRNYDSIIMLDYLIKNPDYQKNISKYLSNIIYYTLNSKYNSNLSKLSLYLLQQLLVNSSNYDFRLYEGSRILELDFINKITVNEEDIYLYKYGSKLIYTKTNILFSYLNASEIQRSNIFKIIYDKLVNNYNINFGSLKINENGEYFLENSNSIIFNDSNKEILNFFERYRGYSKFSTIGTDQNILDFDRISSEYQLLKNNNETTYMKNIVSEMSKRYKISESNIYKLMNTLDGTCTYANLANLIFYAFKDNSLAFKEKFGFDMYTIIDGQKVLNTKELLLDMYIFANCEENDGVILTRDSFGNLKFAKIFDNIIGKERDANNSEKMYMSYYRDSNYSAKKYLEKYQLSIESIPIQINFNDQVNINDLQKIIDTYSSLGYTLSYVENMSSDVLHFNTDTKEEYSSNNWSSGHVTTILGYNEEGVIVLTWGYKAIIPYSDITSVNSTIFANNIKYDTNQKSNTEILSEILNMSTKDIIEVINNNRLISDDILLGLDDNRFSEIMSYLLPKRNKLNQIMNIKNIRKIFENINEMDTINRIAETIGTLSDIFDYLTKEQKEKVLKNITSSNYLTNNQIINTIKNMKKNDIIQIMSSGVFDNNLIIEKTNLNNDIFKSKAFDTQALFDIIINVNNKNAYQIINSSNIKIEDLIKYAEKFNKTPEVIAKIRGLQINDTYDLNYLDKTSSNYSELLNSTSYDKLYNLLSTNYIDIKDIARCLDDSKIADMYKNNYLSMTNYLDYMQLRYEETGNYSSIYIDDTVLRSSMLFNNGVIDNILNSIIDYDTQTLENFFNNIFNNNENNNYSGLIYLIDLLNANNNLESVLNNISDVNIINKLLELDYNQDGIKDIIEYSKYRLESNSTDLVERLEIDNNTEISTNFDTKLISSNYNSNSYSIESVRINKNIFDVLIQNIFKLTHDNDILNIFNIVDDSYIIDYDSFKKFKEIVKDNLTNIENLFDFKFNNDKLFNIFNNLFNKTMSEIDEIYFSLSIKNDSESISNLLNCLVKNMFNSVYVGNDFNLKQLLNIRGNIIDNIFDSLNKIYEKLSYINDATKLLIDSDNIFETFKFSHDEIDIEVEQSLINQYIYSETIDIDELTKHLEEIRLESKSQWDTYLTNTETFESGDDFKFIIYGVVDDWIGKISSCTLLTNNNILNYDGIKFGFIFDSSSVIAADNMEVNLNTVVPNIKHPRQIENEKITEILINNGVPTGIYYIIDSNNSDISSKASAIKLLESVSPLYPNIKLVPIDISNYSEIENISEDSNNSGNNFFDNFFNYDETVEETSTRDFHGFDEIIDENLPSTQEERNINPFNRNEYYNFEDEQTDDESVDTSVSDFDENTESIVITSDVIESLKNINQLSIVKSFDTYIETGNISLITVPEIVKILENQKMEDIKSAYNEYLSNVTMSSDVYDYIVNRVNNIINSENLNATTYIKLMNNRNMLNSLIKEVISRGNATKFINEISGNLEIEKDILLNYPNMINNLILNISNESLVELYDNIKNDSVFDSWQSNLGYSSIIRLLQNINDLDTTKIDISALKLAIENIGLNELSQIFVNINNDKNIRTIFNNLSEYKRNRLIEVLYQNGDYDTVYNKLNNKNYKDYFDICRKSYENIIKYKNLSIEELNKISNSRLFMSITGNNLFELLSIISEEKISKITASSNIISKISNNLDSIILYEGVTEEIENVLLKIRKSNPNLFVDIINNVELKNLELEQIKLNCKKIDFSSLDIISRASDFNIIAEILNNYSDENLYDYLSNLNEISIDNILKNYDKFDNHVIEIIKNVLLEKDGLTIEEIQDYQDKYLKYFDSFRGKDKEYYFGTNQNIRYSYGYESREAIRIYKTKIFNDMSNKYNASITVIQKIFNDIINRKSGACSYAAACNSIFIEFRGREQEFKQVFGFDMYIEIDGERVLNSKELLLDMFIDANLEKNGGKIFNNGQNGGIYINTIDGKDGKRLADDREQVYMSTKDGFTANLLNYLERHGIKTTKFNIENYYRTDGKLNTEYVKFDLLRRLAKGEIIKLGEYSDYNVITGIQEKNEIIFEFLDTGRTQSTYKWKELNKKSNESEIFGGHATTIVGVNDEGIIVASWGSKCLIRFEYLDSDNSVFHGIKLNLDNISTTNNNLSSPSMQNDSIIQIEDESVDTSLRDFHGFDEKIDENLSSTHEVVESFAQSSVKTISGLSVDADSYIGRIINGLDQTKPKIEQAMYLYIQLCKNMVYDDISTFYTKFFDLVTKNKNSYIKVNGIFTDENFNEFKSNVIENVSKRYSENDDYIPTSRNINCITFSRLYRKLLREYVGIPDSDIRINGTYEDNIVHYWISFKLNNEYYIADPTNDEIKYGFERRRPDLINIKNGVDPIGFFKIISPEAEILSNDNRFLIETDNGQSIISSYITEYQNSDEYKLFKSIIKSTGNIESKIKIDTEKLYEIYQLGIDESKKKRLDELTKYDKINLYIKKEVLNKIKYYGISESMVSLNKILSNFSEFDPSFDEEWYSNILEKRFFVNDKGELSLLLVIKGDHMSIENSYLITNQGDFNMSYEVNEITKNGNVIKNLNKLGVNNIFSFNVGDQNDNDKVITLYSIPN